MTNYVELNFSVEPKEQGSDVLITQLAELGFESFSENENGFCGYIREQEFDENQVNLALSFYQDFYKFNYTKKVIPPENWNKQWEDNFQPIEIGGKCYIRAPFHEKRKEFIYEIIIEPKMSFGTSHHATTQLMIQKLLTLDIKNKPLLDMGCGTGVLAIMASMLGANPIMAVDIDEWSFENTVENLEKNNINNVNVEKGDVKNIEGKVFQTILANINKNILLNDMKSYFQSLEIGGNLIISGFFETDVAELSEKAKSIGLNYSDKLVINEWALLHFIK